MRVEEQDEGQEDQREGESGECQVENPLFYFYNCNNESSLSNLYAIHAEEYLCSSLFPSHF